VNDWLRHGATARAWCCAAIFGIFLIFGGCRAKDRAREGRLYARIKQQAQPVQPTPGKMAASGRDEIVTECAHETYANAAKGLIVGETGLHEDVFALRDRDSLAANAYDLDEALRLEQMLHAEINGPPHPEEQAQCIGEFVAHLEVLTDALIQADKAQKELDVSAFNDSRKQAEEQLEKKRREILQEPPAAPQ